MRGRKTGQNGSITLKVFGMQVGYHPIFIELYIYMLKSSCEKLPKNCPQLRGYPTHLRITCAVFSGWFGWSSGVPGRLRRVDRTQSDDQHLSLFDLNQGVYFHIIKCHFFWWRNIFPCEAKKGSDVSRSLSVALAWRCCKLLFGISP